MNCELPLNPDEQHYFGGSDEHFPIFAECSGLKNEGTNEEIQLSGLLFNNYNRAPFFDTNIFLCVYGLGPEGVGESNIWHTRYTYLRAPQTNISFRDDYCLIPFYKKKCTNLELYN